MPTSHVNPVVSGVPPWAVQQRIGTTAGRLALNSMLMPRTDSGLTYIDYRSGVMASGDGDTTHLAMKVSAGSGMTVTVAQGNCVINTSAQGAYMCCLDSQKTVTIPASSATTNRYDMIVACVYDDNNTVLNSPAGTRQFTVEVLQGDGATGTPTVPTVQAGMIPLASVYVGANQTTITASNITDLRGPGIVARGGMRALYGADSRPGSAAWTAPGAYPGDQRWVHNAVFQHQVYYGSSTGWRGVHNCLVYTANPAASSGIQWHKTAGTDIGLCSITIPDPGTPYMIYPTGRVKLWLGPGVQTDVSINLNSAGGTYVNWSSMSTLGIAAPGPDSYLTGNIAPVMYGPFTGAQTVWLAAHLIGAPSTDYGYGYDGRDAPGTLLSINVYPSTVPPAQQ